MKTVSALRKEIKTVWKLSRKIYKCKLFQSQREKLKGVKPLSAAGEYMIKVKEVTKFVTER